jgi:hypothetical protein
MGISMTYYFVAVHYLNSSRMASSDEDQNLKIFFNDLLSRCDTIHDFTSARATNAMGKGMTIDNIYASIETIDELSQKELEKLFSNLINDTSVEEDFKRILRHESRGRFNFLEGYDTGDDVKHVGYEPSVVQFFEHTLSAEGLLDQLYLLSSSHLKNACMIDFVESGERTIPCGNVCLMDLGNTGRVEDDEGGLPEDNTDKEDAGRVSSGIFASDDVRRQFQSSLFNFFLDDDIKEIKFVIDASIVNSDVFRSSDVNLSIVNIISGKWDSALKPSTQFDEAASFVTKKGETNGVLYVIDELFLDNNNGGEFRVGGAKAMHRIDNFPREVGNLVLCATGQDTQSKAYIAAMEQIYPKQTPIQRLPVLFDIKRSGDGCQVLEVLELNSPKLNSNRRSSKYVLVTNDHLAFLKARMNKCPVIFTKRNNVRNTKALICVNDKVKNQSKLFVQEIKAIRDELETILSITNGNSFSACVASFESVIEIVEKDVASLHKLWFPGNGDEHFHVLIYKHIQKSGRKDLPFEFLYNQQITDLEFISARIKIYIYDFMCCSLGLKTRLLLLHKLRNLLSLLGERITNTLRPIYSDEGWELNQYDSETISGYREDLNMFQAIIAKLKLFGYEKAGYNWTNSQDMNRDDVHKALEEWSTDIRNVNEEKAIELVVKHHLGLADNEVMQQILNFKPQLVYTQMWKFLAKGFLNKSLSETQRATRGNKGEVSHFIESWNKTYAKSKNYSQRQDLSPQEQLKAKKFVDELYEYDPSFYKLLVLENFDKNFGFYLRENWDGTVNDFIDKAKIALSNTNHASYGGTNTVYHTREKNRVYYIDDPIEVNDLAGGNNNTNTVKNTVNNSDTKVNLKIDDIQSALYKAAFIDFSTLYLKDSEGRLRNTFDFKSFQDQFLSLNTMIDSQLELETKSQEPQDVDYTALLSATSQTIQPNQSITPIHDINKGKRTFQNLGYEQEVQESSQHVKRQRHANSQNSQNSQNWLHSPHLPHSQHSPHSPHSLHSQHSPHSLHLPHSQKSQNSQGSQYSHWGSDDEDEEGNYDHLNIISPSSDGKLALAPLAATTQENMFAGERDDFSGGSSHEEGTQKGGNIPCDVAVDSLVAYANENVELIMQIVGIVLIYVVVNAPLYNKHVVVRPKTVAMAMLANVLVLVFLIALELPDPSKFVAMAMFLSAIGVDLIRLKNAHGRNPPKHQE